MAELEEFGVQIEFPRHANMRNAHKNVGLIRCTAILKLAFEAVPPALQHRYSWES